MWNYFLFLRKMEEKLHISTLSWPQAEVYDKGKGRQTGQRFALKEGPLGSRSSSCRDPSPRRGESLRRTGKVLPVCLDAGQTAAYQNQKCMIREKGGKPVSGLLWSKALLGHAHRHAMTHPPGGERVCAVPGDFSSVRILTGPLCPLHLLPFAPSCLYFQWTSLCLL